MKRFFAFIIIFSLLFTLWPSSGAFGEETLVELLPYEFPEEGFSGLNDPNLLRYVEDKVYDSLVRELDSDSFFVEKVSALYISKEYLEEVAYNSLENIYFGYTLAEVMEAFSGTKYVFSLGEENQTIVKAFEHYDDTFDKIIRNVTIGTGVILLCVTVSVVSGGVGGAAVSVIFAASAKSATTLALSSGLLSGVTAGVITSFQTDDFEEVLKTSALAASESFKWGALTGAITGGIQSKNALRGATTGGLTMNQVAKIQRESKFPLDVISQLENMKQYEVLKKANVKAYMVGGKTALIQEFDLTSLDEFGRTNLQRMKTGLAPLDKNGVAYELHHLAQKSDGTLVMLTQEEHRLGEKYGIWHKHLDKPSEIDRTLWNKERGVFWKDVGRTLSSGGK